MMKKLFMTVAMAIGGFGLMSWAGLGSYMTTALANVRTHLKQQVPLEFEIQRVQHQVDDLVPEMNKNCRAVAEQKVGVEDLKKEITTLRASLQQRKDHLQTLIQGMDSGAEFVDSDGRRCGPDRVSARVEQDMTACKRGEAELGSKEKLLESRQKALEAAEEKLAVMRSQKQELATQVAQMEADLQTLRLAQAKSKDSLDDSKLSECKQTLTEIRHRLDVEAKAVDLESQVSDDPIPAAEKKAKSPEEVTREAKAYLAHPAAGEDQPAAGR